MFKIFRAYQRVPSNPSKIFRSTFVIFFNISKISRDSYFLVHSFNDARLCFPILNVITRSPSKIHLDSSALGKIAVTILKNKNTCKKIFVRLIFTLFLLIIFLLIIGDKILSSYSKN